ncbi:unnamed protein product [Rhizophagus irregularis]|nr:unnamed protein product [Rhizophagus irregularis]CAB5382769.1 unnamed protein product [Rhizophagus irregularis]
MNEFLSEEPEISEHVPKFLVDVIMKCWNAKAEDRPTAKELVHVFGKWIDEKDDENSEIYFQIKKGDEKVKIRLIE